jgi:hypothetical protein
MMRHLGPAKSSTSQLDSSSLGSRASLTLWVVDDAVVKQLVKVTYEILFSDLEDGSVMDCTK